MRKLVISIVIFLYGLDLISQDCISVLPTNNYNTINLSFEMPHYSIVDTIVPDNIGRMQNFSYIDVMDDNFGVIDSLGFPILPYLPINIAVPKNSSNYLIIMDNVELEQVEISNYIIPSQQDVSKELYDYTFTMNTNFYTSNESFHRLNIEIEDEFIIFGEKGVTLSLIPFEYNPANSYIRVLKSANIKVLYNTVNNAVDNRRYTNTTEMYLNNYFYNYTENRGDIDKDNYLIITHPMFVDAIRYFANYKRNIGFNVDVVSTDSIGNNSDTIKSFIQSRYKQTNTRPEYVLLVGDVDKIPISGGVSDDEDNPYTDINYSLLEGDDLKADVFIGRLPVSTLNELQNIINKTIYMEMNLPYQSRRVSLIAGYENNWFMESYFEKGHNSAVKKAFDSDNYECTKLYQPTEYQITNSFLNNPTFLIYSGHGSNYSWASVNSQDLSISRYNVMNYQNVYFPFVFAFACNTGNYTKNDCIGEEWLILNNKGAVTYFGSSIVTKLHPDYLIEKKIFDDDYSESLSISMLINQGKNKYHDHCFGLLNRRMKRYLKSYNLLGDPSIVIGGVGHIDDLVFTCDESLGFNEYTEYYSSTIKNDADLVLNTNSTLYLHASNEIILSDGFYATEGANFMAEVIAHDLSGNATVTSRSNQDMNDQHEDDDVIYKDEVELLPSNANPSHISIYPNPANDNITIELSSDCHTIEIYDSFGRMMMSQQVNKTTSQQVVDVDISKYPSGLYLVVVKDDNNRYYKRIVKN